MKERQAEEAKLNNNGMSATEKPTKKQEYKCYDRNNVDFYNERSRIVRAHAGDAAAMLLFDYSPNMTTELTMDDAGYVTQMETVETCIDQKHLKALKDANNRAVLKHPMVLHFINERLIECAVFYFSHIIAYFSFLLTLSWHIFSKETFKDVLVTLFVIMFLFFMLLKGAIKARVPKLVSPWFIIAYTFNILTLLSTLAYVWLPHLFEYDDFHQEVKIIILWALPIIAVMSAWVNFLYIMRKSPYGIYILMMVRILKSFRDIATIWVPTLIAFSFAFHLILRDSTVEPWSSSDTYQNATTLHKLFVILQAVTKTSTMMVGEVDANDILGTRQWIPSILLLAFDIISVMLLMNLMISLAVGDVNDLRNTSQDKILIIKLNFVIEALQLTEILGCSLCTTYTSDVLVLTHDGECYAQAGESLEKHPTSLPQEPDKNEPHELLRQIMALIESTQTCHNCHTKERVRRKPFQGIPELESTYVSQDKSSRARRAKQWLIGLDLHSLLELPRLL